MSILQRHKDYIYGLSDELLTLSDADTVLQQNIDAEAAARAAADGDLTTLTTTEKGSLVGAINEALSSAQAGSSSALQIANNLSDVADVVVARTNLGVSSTVEIDAAIQAAKLALGTNFTVTTLAERDAMTDLDDGDRVLVRDGDGVVDSGNWVLFKPTNIVDGVPGDWMMLSSKESFEGSTSAEAIKLTYESNLDTNAYTDADKAKVDLVTVTQAIDLDDAVLKAALEQDLEVAAPLNNAPSAAAVKAYADAAATAGGSIPVMETVSVVGSLITLTNTPKEGVNGVMNFGMVRYTDVNGVAYDAPVVATATPNEFTISTDTADQWNGFSVQIQYLYVPAV